MTSPTVVDADSATHPADGPALRVVVVTGSPRRRSKTMGLADAILDTLRGMLPVEASRVDVYRLGSGFTGAVERDGVTAEVEATLRPPQAQALAALAPGRSEDDPRCQVAVQPGTSSTRSCDTASSVPGVSRSRKRTAGSASELAERRSPWG